MVDLRLMVANLKFIFLICFQQETLADGIVPRNVNVLIINLILYTIFAAFRQKSGSSRFSGKVGIQLFVGAPNPSF